MRQAADIQTSPRHAWINLAAGQELDLHVHVHRRDGRMSLPDFGMSFWKWFLLGWEDETR